MRASLCPQGGFVTTIKVGVREFRERIASFLESDIPVAVTRRGETLGVFIPTQRSSPKQPTSLNSRLPPPD
jgi:hypothetical protein